MEQERPVAPFFPVNQDVIWTEFLPHDKVRMHLECGHSVVHDANLSIGAAYASVTACERCSDEKLERIMRLARCRRRIREIVKLVIAASLLGAALYLIGS